MSEFKSQVEYYLKHDRTLIGGKNLYNKMPQKSKAMQNAFSRFANTPANVDKVCYELAKAVEMEDRILKMLTQNPVVMAKEIDAIETVKEAATPTDLLLKFAIDTTDYASAKALLKALGIETPDKKKDTVFNTLFDARAALIKETLNGLPQEVKASIKLREQFPWIKDAKCPPVFHLLTARLITAYENFRANQPKLHDLLGPEESKALAETVLGDWLDNKMAWEELECYNKTQTILGEHPLFKRLELKEAINAMDTAALTKKINALTVNVSRNKDNPELLERDEDLLAHAKEVLGKR